MSENENERVKVVDGWSWNENLIQLVKLIACCICLVWMAKVESMIVKKGNS